MALRDQKICLYLVPLFCCAFLLSFWNFNGFFPPISPGLSATEVADFYRENLASIRTSMIICNLIGVSLIPFYTVIVTQMMRMKNSSRVFAYSYLIAVVNGATMFALADLAWLIAAFRPDRDPQLIQLLNDFAWLAFTTPVGFILIQNLCLALAIYLDKNEQPIFPRWVGHFNIATALIMAPSAMAIMHKSGPLAWDGLISFWLKFITFSLYIAVMFFVVRSALIKQERQRTSEPLNTSSYSVQQKERLAL